MRWLPLFACVVACQPAPSLFGPGLHLQLRVADAQLRSGKIKGDKGGPEVSQVLRPQPEVARGDASVKLDGRLAKGGVALHLQAVGDPDHWVLPTKGYDFVVQDELQFSAALEFSHAIQRDEVTLRLAAADERGRLGPVTETTFAMLPDAPPARLLVSLAWDAPADVDLHVVDANGVVIGAKNINSLEPLPGQILTEEEALQGGYLEFDSNKHCHLDLRNRENIIWQFEPPPGRYEVFAHLFSPCEVSSVNMETLVQLDGEPVAHAGTTQYAFDAREHFSEGEAPGLFLTGFTVP